MHTHASTQSEAQTDTTANIQTHAHTFLTPFVFDDILVEFFKGGIAVMEKLFSA